MAKLDTSKVFAPDKLEAIQLYGREKNCRWRNQSRAYTLARKPGPRVERIALGQMFDEGDESVQSETKSTVGRWNFKTAVEYAIEHIASLQDLGIKGIELRYHDPFRDDNLATLRVEGAKFGQVAQNLSELIAYDLANRHYARKDVFGAWSRGRTDRPTSTEVRIPKYVHYEDDTLIARL